MKSLHLWQLNQSRNLKWLDPREAQSQDRVFNILSGVDHFTMLSTMRTLTHQIKSSSRKSKPCSHLERPKIDISTNKQSEMQNNKLAQDTTILAIRWPTTRRQHTLGARTQSLDSNIKNYKVLTKSSILLTRKTTGRVVNKGSSLRLHLPSNMIIRFQEPEHIAQTKNTLKQKLHLLESEWIILIRWFTTNSNQNWRHRHLLLVSLRRITKKTFHSTVKLQEQQIRRYQAIWRVLEMEKKRFKKLRVLDEYFIK